MVGVGALTMGTLFIWSAWKNVDPLTLVRDTFAGRDPRRNPIDPDPGFSRPPNPSGGGGSFPSGSGTFSWPTKARAISAGFGEKGPMWETFHTGVDIDGECGDPIWAAAPGTITQARANGPYGLQVKQSVTGLRDTEIWYNHLSRIDVRAGQAVSVGDKIGPMGTTGSSTGCHLHFEVRISGRPTNPMPYFQGGNKAGAWNKDAGSIAPGSDANRNASDRPRVSPGHGRMEP